MTRASISFHTNPRFVPDDLAVRFGASVDAALVYDSANDEFTIQTANAGGTLTDRVRIQANVASPTVDMTGMRVNNLLAGLDDGSAAAPSLAFDADADLGIYRIGADIIGVASGGAEVARFYASGLRLNDSLKALFGSGADAEIYYDGVNLVVNPQAVGSGQLRVTSGDLKVYRANDKPQIHIEADRGTPANGDILGFVNFQGDDDSSSSRTFADVYAESTDVAAATASGALFFETRQSGALATRVRIDAGLQVGSPTGGDKGAGTINAQAVYDDNVLLTDYVFEDGYALPSIDEMRSFFEREKRLPTIPGRAEWERSRFSLGKLATHLWETVEVQARYIGELGGRISALEERS